MNKEIVFFRQKLRSDILHFLYEKFFHDSTFYSAKDIYDGLGNYLNKCPIGLLYTFELNAAIAYLEKKGYIESSVYEKYRSTNIDKKTYNISTNGVEFLESLYNEQTDNKI